jgi:hypothetical protein
MAAKRYLAIAAAGPAETAGSGPAMTLAAVFSSLARQHDASPATAVSIPAMISVMTVMPIAIVAVEGFVGRVVGSIEMVGPVRHMSPASTPVSAPVADAETESAAVKAASISAWMTKATVATSLSLNGITKQATDGSSSHDNQTSTQGPKQGFLDHKNNSPGNDAGDLTCDSDQPLAQTPEVRSHFTQGVALTRGKQYRNQRNCRSRASPMPD